MCKPAERARMLPLDSAKCVHTTACQSTLSIWVHAHTNSHLWQPALHSQHALQVEDVVPQPPVLLQALGELQTQPLNLPHRGHECNTTRESHKSCDMKPMSHECERSRSS